MQAHTKMHRTKNPRRSFNRKNSDRSIQSISFFEEEKGMSADEMIKNICGDLPEYAAALRGLRYREELTQSALGDLLGIAQTNISKMELGKRHIGKNLAKKLADFFHTDYKIFL